jgi:hypothetical protein
MAKLQSDRSEQIVTIPVRTVISENLEGSIVLPTKSNAMVVLVQANKSKRQRLLNKWVSFQLRMNGLGTLLLDLSPGNDHKPNHTRFRVDLLSQRLKSVTEWLLSQPYTKSSKIGYFGTSMGAAATFEAAAVLSYNIGAVVAAAGRPDLALSSEESLSPYTSDRRRQRSFDP